MSRFVGFAYPDGLYILDTLTGKVSKVPTGEGPVLPDFGDETPGALSSGAHPALFYPHSGVPGATDAYEPVFAQGETIDPETGDLNPVSEAIALLGANIPTAPGVAEAPLDQTDDAADTQVVPAARLDPAFEPEASLLDPDSTYLGVGPRTPDPEESAAAAAILAQPPPPGWTTGDHSVAVEAEDEEGLDASEPLTTPETDTPSAWKRSSVGSNTDQIPAFQVDGESDLQDRETPHGLEAIPELGDAATEENEFARSLQRDTGRSAAPWLDPLHEGTDGAAHRAPTASHSAVGEVEPEGLARRPAPKTDPGLIRAAFGTDPSTRKLRDTAPGFPSMEYEAVERAVIAETLHEVEAERDQLIRRVPSAEFEVAVELSTQESVSRDEAAVADRWSDELARDGLDLMPPDDAVTAEKEAVAALAASAMHDAVTEGVELELLGDEEDEESLLEVGPLPEVVATPEESDFAETIGEIEPDEAEGLRTTDGDEAAVEVEPLPEGDDAGFEAVFDDAALVEVEPLPGEAEPGEEPPGEAASVEAAVEPTPDDAGAPDFEPSADEPLGADLPVDAAPDKGEAERFVGPELKSENADFGEIALLPSEAYLAAPDEDDRDDATEIDAADHSAMGDEPDERALSGRPEAAPPDEPVEDDALSVEPALEEDIAFAFEAIDAAEEALEVMSSEFEVVTAEQEAVGEMFESVAGAEAATVSVEGDPITFEVYVAPHDEADDLRLEGVEETVAERAPAVEPDREYLVSYPYPVAVTHLGFVSSAEPGEQCRRLAETFAAVMKLWAYQLLAQYLAEPSVVDTQLDALVKRHIGRPDVASLCALITEGLRALSQAGLTPFAPELAAAWERLETDCPEQVGVPVSVEETPGQVEVRLVELSPVRALTLFCESLIYGTPSSDGAARAQLGVHLPILRVVLDAGAFMTDYEICATELPADPEAARAEALDTADLMRPDRDPGALYAHRLVGAVPSSEAEVLAGVDAATATSPVFLAHKETGRVLPLGAFYVLTVATAADQAISGLDRELFTLAGLTHDEVFFTSPSGEVLADPEAATPWRERLAALPHDHAPRIGPEISRLDLTETASAVTRRALLKRSADGLTLGGTTQERPEITEQLVRFDYGDYRGFVLGGHSGAGKSTLLAQLAEVRLERGDVVLYYAAAELDETPLGQRIMTDLGVPELPMRAFLEGGHELFRAEVVGAGAGLEQPHLFVLVDGVHEHRTNPGHLIDDIDSLVANATKTPWFRLVASVRSSRYAHLPLASRFGRNPDARYLLIEEVSGIGRERTPIVELPPLNPDELGRLYETYRAYRRPNAVDGGPGLNTMCPETAFTELDPTGSTCSMIRRPLMLRFTLSAFHGRELPSDLSYGVVFSSFLDQVVAEEDNPSGAFPERRGFLTTLVREMDARSRHWIERDLLYEIPTLREALTRASSDSPYSQLTQLGILIESWQEGRWVVRFASERLFEYLLAKHLEVGLDSADDVWALAMRAAQLPSVRGALGVILLEAARHGRKDLLTESLARIDDEDSGAGRLEAGVITDAVVDVLEHLGITRDPLFGELLPAVTPEARPPMIVPLLFLFDRLFRAGAVHATDPVAHRAVLLSEQLGDAELLSRALCCRAQREEDRGELEQALSTYAQALQRGNEAGNLLAGHRINARCGAVLRRQGVGDTAIELLAQASDGLADVGAQGEAARAKFEQGELAGEQGDLEGEIARTQEALRLAEGGVERSIEARALGKLAWLCLRSSNPEEGLDYQARAHAAAESVGDFRTLSSMQNLKGLVSWDQNFELAARAFVESRDLAQRLGDGRALMVASSNLADLRLLQGHLEEAESLVRSAIKLARKLSDGEQEAWNLGKLSKVALEAGTLTQAQSLAEEALRRNEKLGSERGQAWALGYLAEVGLEHGQMEVARTLVMRAVEISERSGEMVNLTWLWEILGHSYARVHRLDPAESHFRHIRTAGEKVSSPYAIATGLVGLADVEARRSRWDEAETMLREALERFEVVDSPVGLSLVKRRLGNLFLEQSRYEEARPYLDEAFTVARTLANPRLWAKAHQAIAELLKEQGHVAQAKDRATQALEIRKILDHPLELAESWATVGVCLDLDEAYDEGAQAYAQSLKYAQAVGFEPAVARALFLSASQSIDRGAQGPLHEWAEQLADLARRTSHPLVKAINTALVARLATLEDDEFRLHNALLDVESAYALLPGHTPVELSPASAYHDSAYFYLSKGRPRRCKEMTKLCRQTAGSRPFPRMAELRKLPLSDHTSDFEAIPT